MTDINERGTEAWVEETTSRERIRTVLDVEVVPQVTLAVLQLWRDAVGSGNLDHLQQPTPL